MEAEKKIFDSVEDILAANIKIERVKAEAVIYSTAEWCKHQYAMKLCEKILDDIKKLERTYVE